MCVIELTRMFKFFNFMYIRNYSLVSCHDGVGYRWCMDYHVTQ